MTTTALVLFEDGLEELVVVADSDDARDRAATEEALLLGERGGVKPDSFDGGNSPLEYLGRDLNGKRAVVCTSNGSKAVEASSEADLLLLGAIRNAGSVARAALSRADRLITLVCAGTGGHISYDDVVAAGVILKEIVRTGAPVELSDGARLALAVADVQPDICSLLLRARSAQALSRLGFAEDIDFASELNSSTTVPVMTRLRPPTFALPD